MADPSTAASAAASAAMIATPLRVEAAAVRRGATTATVIRTGMGPRRSRAARHRLAGEQPLAVMGVAGGLAPYVQPTDVVVASEVRGADGTVACAGSEVLAADLRRLGLRAHVGPLISTEKIVHGKARVALAATGAIAVDLETDYLVTGWTGRPLVAVRVISDTAAAPLLHPGIVPRGYRCLGVLRRITPLVEAWGHRQATKAQRDLGSTKETT